MPVLDALLQALADKQSGRVNPLRVAQAVGDVAGAVDQLQDPSTQQLLTHIVGPWALKVATEAPKKWMLRSDVPPSCFLEVNGGVCGTFAVGMCHICGRPVCLGHAMVGGDATLVCWACMRVAAQHAPKWKAPSTSEPAGASKSSTDWAYELLGLEKDCTLLEARKAYKQRVARFHPDKSGAGADSRPNGDLLRTLKRAYDVVQSEKASK